MNKRLQVLCLCKWYPNKLDELDGIFVVDHLRAISSLHDVAALFVHSDYRLKDKRNLESNADKGYFEVKIYFRPFQSKIAFINKAVNAYLYFSNQLRGYRLIRKEWAKPTICHVHVMTRTALFAFWLKIKRIPFVITEHSSNFINLDKNGPLNLKRRLQGYLFSQSSGVSAVSNYLLKALPIESSFPNKKVISNTVDEQQFLPKFDHKSGVFRFIHISGLTDEPKNFGGILEALSILNSEGLTFDFIAIGKGEELEKQKEKAKELGLFPMVKFMGYLEKKQIIVELQKSDAFVLFSDFETQSCALLEATLCGLPCISTDVGGPKEIINESNGILISRGNINELANTMKGFLNKSFHFNKQLIRNNSLKYGYPAIAKQFDDFYKEALK